MKDIAIVMICGTHNIIYSCHDTIREALGYEDNYGDVSTCMVAFTSLMF